MSEVKKESKAATFKRKKIEEGYKYRGFWLTKEGIEALKHIKNNLDSEADNQDRVVDTAIRLVGNLSEDEYTHLLKRINR